MCLSLDVSGVLLAQRRLVFVALFGYGVEGILVSVVYKGQSHFFIIIIRMR
jgi:hypothetical protein